MNTYKKNNPKKKKILIYSISTILAIIIILAVGGDIYIKKILDKVETIEVNTDNIGINTEAKEEFKEIKNITLLGIDSRVDDLIERSDSIRILTLDIIHNKIKITSIMRDSYVNIDGYRTDKIIMLMHKVVLNWHLKL